VRPSRTPVLILLALAGFPALAAGEPLRILLTNDDGYRAPGISAVREALIDAGHDVIVVAPHDNQSGSGVRLTTSGQIRIVDHKDDVWSVHGSPADAVLVARRRIMRNDPPDLVVSGANFGQNLAYGSSSGTVGAATMSVYSGVPAIAISVGVVPTERRAEPRRYPSTFAAFPGAAAFVVDLIETLQDSAADGAGLLPEHTLLNVNYPARLPERIAGVSVLPAARGADISLGYQRTPDPEIFDVIFESVEIDETRLAGTDIEAFRAGYIVITVFDGIWDAGDLPRNEVADRLGNMLE
jgi:5'/3'-nucleotidase SurE